MTDLILLTIICIFVAFFMGMRYERTRILRIIANNLNDLEDDQEEVIDKVPEGYMRMRIELHDNVMYAYSTEDGTYLAHHSDSEQLLANLADRFKDTKFIADPESIDIMLKRSNHVPL